MLNRFAKIKWHYMYRMFTIAPGSGCVVNIDYSPLKFAVDVTLNFGNTNIILEYKAKNSPISFTYLVSVFGNTNMALEHKVHIFLLYH